MVDRGWHGSVFRTTDSILVDRQIERFHAPPGISLENLFLPEKIPQWIKDQLHPGSDGGGRDVYFYIVFFLNVWLRKPAFVEGAS